MNLNEVIAKDGQQVTFRTGIDNYPNGVEWDEWRTGKLTVHKRSQNLSKAYRTQTHYWHKGDPFMFTFERNHIEPLPEDYNEDFNSFAVEEYRIEIRP